MSEELSEAVGAVLGLGIGGIVLMYVGINTSTTFAANVTTWGFLLFLGAIALSIVVVYVVTQAVFGGGGR